MRAVAVSVWIFINLVFVGMCGYIYLLWSQYWQYVERQQEHMMGLMGGARSSGGGAQILYYPSTYPEPAFNSTTTRYNRTSTGQKVVRWRNSQPRFPKPRADESRCMGDKASSRVLAHKSQLVVQLRRVLLEESSVFRARGEVNNPYNVHYTRPRGSYIGKSVQQLVCSLRHKVGGVRTVSSQDEPFRSLGIGHLLPQTPIFMDKYNTCAVVTNAGSLFGSGLGTFIDKLKLPIDILDVLDIASDLLSRFKHFSTHNYKI